MFCFRPPCVSEVEVHCSSCRMAFMNAVIRTVRSSTFPLTIRKCAIKQVTFKVCDQLSQYRMLMLSHCWRSQNKPTSAETLNLDSWKNILRSGTQSTTDQKESGTPEKSSIECMQEESGTEEESSIECMQEESSIECMQEESGTEEDSSIECMQEESGTEEESSIESMQKLVDMWRLAGKKVPDHISTEQLMELQKRLTKSSRRDYLKDLKHKELRNMEKKRKQLEKQMLRGEMESRTERVSTYLLKLFTNTIDLFYCWRTVQAMIHGQPLVFDMAYDQYMSQKELKNTIQQLMMCEGFNKISDDPFHLHFCNFKAGGPYHKELVNRYHEAWDNILITSTEKSYVDIFPRDRLVYLTADSPNELKEFDNDKIYIIGAFVDKSQKTGTSLGKAKRLKLATARLPLDNYLKWDHGAKTLTLNQVTEILMTLKLTGDWQRALLSVPQRKHSGFLSQNRLKVGERKFQQKSSNKIMQTQWWEKN